MSIQIIKVTIKNLKKNKKSISLTIAKCDKDTYGTDIILTIKENDEEEYDNFLEEYHIKSLIKKYSDYITYPIKMEVTIIFQ